MNLRLILSFLRPNLFYKIDSRSKNEEEEENEQNERKDKRKSSIKMVTILLIGWEGNKDKSLRFDDSANSAE